MATSNKEIIIFAEIQKKLFYMIPERWDAIYLYASIIEEPFKKPIGEMYFYYIPKGILKRKPVNVYQIPSLFNIDEESYNELVQRLYLDIKQLRNVHREIKNRLWTNLTISIENLQFKVEYGYEDLGPNAEFSPYERHIIWRYKNLKIDPELQTKEEKNIINRYFSSDLIQFEKGNNDIYIENMYRQQEHNIIDYEKTLTLEAAIAAQQEELQEEKFKKEKKLKKKKDKKKSKELGNFQNEGLENQILFSRVEKMKNITESKEVKNSNDDFDDDIILSSDFMTKRD
ncbi:MAG: immunity protein YezG family protein [Clostridia bacterium]|nr:DUF600 family protein [Clostridia bacterium]